MDELLKGNFKTKKAVTAADVNDANAASHTSTSETIANARRKEMLQCLGGSMVYVEREKLSWDGDE